MTRVMAERSRTDTGLLNVDDGTPTLTADSGAAEHLTGKFLALRTGIVESRCGIQNITAGGSSRPTQGDRKFKW